MGEWGDRGSNSIKGRTHFWPALDIGFELVADSTPINVQRYIILLFAPSSIAFAIPAIDTGLSVVPPGPEESVKDIAVLIEDNLASLPSSYPLCLVRKETPESTKIHPF